MSSTVARCVSEANESWPIMAIAVGPFARHWGDTVLMRTLAFTERLMRTPLAYAAGYCWLRLRHSVLSVGWVSRRLPARHSVPSPFHWRTGGSLRSFLTALDPSHPILRSTPATRCLPRVTLFATATHGSAGALPSPALAHWGLASFVPHCARPQPPDTTLDPSHPICPSWASVSASWYAGGLG